MDGHENRRGYVIGEERAVSWAREVGGWTGGGVQADLDLMLWEGMAVDWEKRRRA